MGIPMNSLPQKVQDAIKVLPSANPPVETAGEVCVILPWPPTSGNHQHGRSRSGKTYTLGSIKQWRIRVAGILAGYKRFVGPVAIRLCATPPDRRERDSDNVEKVVFDAIEGAGTIERDSNICLLKHSFEWEPPDGSDGHVFVDIRSM